MHRLHPACSPARCVTPRLCHTAMASAWTRRFLAWSPRATCLRLPAACPIITPRQHRKHHTFLGFIDFDEFLVFTNPNITSVNQLLKPYAAYGGLALHWILAGANNHTARPNDTVLNRCAAAAGGGEGDGDAEKGRGSFLRHGRGFCWLHPWHGTGTCARSTAAAALAASASAAAHFPACLPHMCCRWTAFQWSFLRVALVISGHPSPTHMRALTHAHAHTDTDTQRRTHTRAHEHMQRHRCAHTSTPPASCAHLPPVHALAIGPIAVPCAPSLAPPPPARARPQLHDLPA